MNDVEKTKAETNQMPFKDDSIDIFMKQEQQQKLRSYHELNRIAVKGQILFTGSSLMEQFPVNEFAMSERNKV